LILKGFGFRFGTFPLSDGVKSLPSGMPTSLFLRGVDLLNLPAPLPCRLVSGLLRSGGTVLSDVSILLILFLGLRSHFWRGG
jgi:hypothetical protein